MRGIIETKDLCKVYKGGSREVYALKDINLTVERGSFTTVVGRSGAGKSTLIHLLSTHEKATSGEIYFAGKELMSLSHREVQLLRSREMALLDQSQTLFRDFSVLENMVIPTRLAGMRIDGNYINEVLDNLDLFKLKNRMVGDLSTGERRRMAIARCLAMRPTIILADEPTSNLDEDGAYKVLSLLKLLTRKYKQTVLMVTHDTVLAQQSDKILRMEHGELTATMEGIGDRYV